MFKSCTSELSLVAFTQSLKAGNIIHVVYLACNYVNMVADDSNDDRCDDRWYTFDGFMLGEDYKNILTFNMQFIETVIGGFLSLRGLELDKVQSYDDTGRLIRFSRRGSERFEKDAPRVKSLEYRVVKMKVPPKNK